MSDQKSYSKLDSILKMLLIAFVCILSFSFGVIAGKGLSDKEHDLQALNEKEYSSEKFIEKAPVKRVPLQVEKQIKDSDVNAMVESAVKEAQMNRASQSSTKKEMAKTPLLPKKKDGPQQAQMKSRSKPDIRGVQKAATRIAMGDSPSSKEGQTKRSRVPSSLPQSVGQKQIGYTVQIASYPTPEDANRHAARLIEKGFPAFPVSAVVKGRTWYRVSVGTFQNRKEAHTYKKQILKQSGIKTAIVQKIGRQ